MQFTKVLGQRAKVRKIVYSKAIVVCGNPPIPPVENDVNLPIVTVIFINNNSILDMLNMMEREKIIEILFDWNLWDREQFTGTKREGYVKNGLKLLETGQAVVITGIRRCGKSVLSRQICKSLIERGIEKKNILIVNFEDVRFEKPSKELLVQIYETYIESLSPKGRLFVVLDEVQLIEGWEKFVRTLQELGKANIIVTGSNSKLLSSEYASSLTGRHLDIQVYPLSFKEFLLFKGIEVKDGLDLISKKHEILSAFDGYIEYGGFPKVVLTEGETEKKEILKSYFKDTIIRDVAMRYKITKISLLEELARYYLMNIASLQSLNNIKNIFRRDFPDTSLDTIQRYSQYFDDVFLIRCVKKFSYSLKEQILNPKKVYCVDTGLRNAIAYRFMKDKGKLFENLVAVGLLREGKEFFYYKDRDYEIDFVVKEGDAIKELIQVCYEIENEETKEREIKGLTKGMEKFNLKTGLIITDREQKEETITGKRILYIPLWKWLLNITDTTGRK